jgi:cell wall-associated NlpC family hydrolase
VPVDRDQLLRELTLRGKAASMELIEAITEPPVLTRTVDGASTLEVTVTDTKRKLLRSGILDTRSFAVVDRINFELVAVSKSSDRVTLTFEDAIVAALRRRRSELSIPAGSTTRAEIAKRLAKEARVRVDVDPQDRGVVNSVVERSVGRDKSDSWVVLGEVADQIRWRRFSTGRRLVVGSDKWITGRGPSGWTVREHTGPVHDVDFDLDVGKRVSEAGFEVDARRWAVWPGRAVTFHDELGPAAGKWMVAEFTRALTRQRARVRTIRARHVLKEPPPAPTAVPGSESGEQDFLPNQEGTLGGGTATNAARERMVQWALAQRGKAYIWGGNGPTGFDCSGLVQEASRAAGKVLTKPSTSQWATVRAAGRAVSVDTAIRTRGALLFRMTGYPTHIAISLGNGSTIEAMGTAYGVLVGSTANRGWTSGGIWI